MYEAFKENGRRCKLGWLNLTDWFNSYPPCRHIHHSHFRNYKEDTHVIIKERVLTSDERVLTSDVEKERKKSERKEKMDAKKAKKNLIKVRLPFSSKKTRTTTRNVLRN